MSDFNGKEKIKKLRKKAENSRNSHGLLQRKYNGTRNLLHSLNLIGSSIVAILTFASFTDFLVLIDSLTGEVYKFAVGLLASTVFILLVLEEFLNLNEKAASHENAVKQLTTFIRTADLIEKSAIVTEDEVNKITNQYVFINENAPLIPDRVFLKSKQKLQRKIYLSKTLDSSPFIPLFVINIVSITKASFKYLLKKIAPNGRRMRMGSSKEESVLVLMSGGVDSTALIHYYLTKKLEVKGVYFNYGQKNYKSEKNSTQRISDYYGIDVQYINLGFALNSINGEIMSRNALFLLMGANFYSEQVSRISIGIHDGIPYYDCSEMFIKDCQNLIDGYFKGTLTVDAPFLLFNKEQILRYCIDNEIPLQYTYSCESNSGRPCGICLSCQDRSKLDEFYSL